MTSKTVFYKRDTAVLLTAVFFAIIAIFASCRLVVGDEPAKPFLAETSNGVYQDTVVESIEDRQLEYPNDASKYFTTVLVSPGDQSQLLHWFRTHQGLYSLSKRTKFNLYDTNSAHYRKSFASSCPEVPCVLIQQPNGQVVFKISGPNIPANPDDLYLLIANAMEVQNGVWSCRPCRPRPDRVPDFDRIPAPFNPIPDSIFPMPYPDQQPASQPEFPWAFLLGICFFVAIGTVIVLVIQKFRNERQRYVG